MTDEDSSGALGAGEQGGNARKMETDENSSGALPVLDLFNILFGFSKN